ncbi:MULTISPECIES: integration host factor subunit alpha [Commensalibacter]|uniref:integration host factor subunit alpha n=1 Tax=Commensalibacter TaxID=1079922 RepID=UPI000EFA8D50|nr:MULTISPECIES: integration host factor subunit alpha [Commensalibacter]AYN86723.1 integration host factor subunit alpha [Commensalibacter melissae]MBH9972673.1 integration host factor subunit alpha [Commensalibacter melissae]MBI0016795.1 integration host factor subunit alpha [Commensalibacter sp. B14384M2]MBI0018540.1 integration host factor subunit alpha [Commensalibacter sp. W8133]MBI0050079.1 integration host factor subunit alpha [Commensalibacter sp. B14384M3]
MQTLTRAGLIEKLYSHIGLSRSESAQLLETVLEKIVVTLEKGDSVKISGFGTFSVRRKGNRIGRNPKTGVEVEIEPRYVLSFRSSQKLKKNVNEGMIKKSS